FESDGRTLTARYGNPTLTSPRYDLEAVRTTLHIDAIPDASWSEARARTSEENAVGPAPPLPVVGAPLDPVLFHHVRSVPAGDAGFVALRLDAAALAHSAGPDRAFSDVRLIDGAARQVPYLVERSSEPLSIDLSLERLATPPRSLVSSRVSRTVYRLQWPFERLPAPR